MQKLKQKMEVSLSRMQYDFTDQIDRINERYLEYKQLVELELKVKDHIIPKLQTLPEDLRTQMKTIMTVMTVPRLRNQLNIYDMKNCKFEEIMGQIELLVQSQASGQI